MIIISKPKFTAIITVLLMLLPTVTLSAHALYTVPLPTNTIYADDFENYPANQKIGCSNAQGYPDGWGWFDCDTGGSANITSTAYYSCCHSLIVGSPNLANAVFDVDKRFFPPTNQTTTIQTDMWFAVSKNYGNQGGNNAHLSLETWGTNSSGVVGRYEAPVFLFSVTSGAPCTTRAGMEIDAIGATTLGFGGTNHVASYCLSFYDTATNRRGVWHHYTSVVNMQKRQWVSLTIDGISLTSLVCPSTCLFFSNHGAGSGNQNGDDSTDWNGQTGLFPYRFEIGAVNGATHNLPADTWVGWHDNLIITDVSPGRPNIVNFGIVTSSGLFQLILITTAMMYVSSGFGTVMRVFAKEKAPKFLGPKFIIITGVVGTSGFLFMLIIGANLVGPACPPGSICNG